MEIFLSFDDEQSKRLKLICAIKDISMAQYINDVMAEHLDSMSASDLVEDIESLFKTDNADVKQNSISSEKGIMIPKSNQRPYKGTLILKRCKFYAMSKRLLELDCDVNTALYIKELGDSFTFQVFKQMADDLHLNHPVFYRFIYNLQNGEFDELIDTFKKKMKLLLTFGIQDGDVYCNKEKMCDVQTAEVIIHQFANSSLKKEETIWRFVQKHPHMDALHIRILCENFDNFRLTRLFEKKETPIVNNREKRENLIKNGGI